MPQHAGRIRLNARHWTWAALPLLLVAGCAAPPPPSGGAVLPRPQAGAARPMAPLLRPEVWQDGRQASTRPTAGGGQIVQLRHAPFTLAVPLNRPGSAETAGEVRVCTARSATVFQGIAEGRSVGLMPCFNGAAQMVGDPEDRPTGIWMGVSDGDGHQLFNAQNAQPGPGMLSIQVRKLTEMVAVGAHCADRELTRCEDLERLQPLSKGTLHLVVFVDRNANRVADAGEFWPLTLEVSGPAQAPAAPGHRPVVRVNGQALTLAEVQHEAKRAGAPVVTGHAAQPLAWASVRLVEQLLAGQEAARLGLGLGAHPAALPDGATGAELEARAQARLRQARTYLEHLANTAPKPSEADSRRFYQAWPELYAQRRVYKLDVITPADAHLHAAALGLQLSGAPTASALAASLRRAGVPFERQALTLAADGVDLPRLRMLARLQPGQGLVVDNGGKSSVAFVVDSTSDPVSFEKAQPAIQRFLAGQAGESAWQAARKRLLSVARVDWAMAPVR